MAPSKNGYIDFLITPYSLAEFFKAMALSEIRCFTITLEDNKELHCRISVDYLDMIIRLKNDKGQCGCKHDSKIKVNTFGLKI